MLGRTVRGLASLFAGVLIGPVALLWVVVTTVISGLLSITYLGPPVFVPVTWITRRVAGLERLRAGWVLGRRIAPPYETVSTRNPWTRGRMLAQQAATWRDLAWLVLLFPLGTGVGLVGTIVAVVTAGMAVAPLWLGFVPNPNAPPVADFFVNTTPGLVLLVPIGLLLTPVSAWLVRRLSVLQATIAEQLLGPGPRQRLVDRATELADTRRRVVDAQAAELQRIERDLHDGAQARIVAAGMTLALTERRLRIAVPEDDPIQEGVRTARRQLDDALTELRRLVRGIHPPILTDRGLAAALAALAGDAPMPVAVDAAEAGQLPAAVESAAYFVVAEALANAAKHSAASECAVVVSRTPDGRLTVEVRDDGRGGADPSGSGLDGLRRRVEALDGTMTITSPAGGPTVIHTEFPCAS